MARAHIVKCKICNQQFDTNKESFVVEGRRYSHKRCVDQLPQEQKDYVILEKYIKELFGINTLTAKIKRQIADYMKEYGYTYSGIYKTLYWWFNVNRSPIEKANNGIGIVPFVYQDAYDYYYRLYLAQTANNIEEINKIHNIEVQRVEIGSPRVRIDPPKLLNFEEGE